MAVCQEKVQSRQINFNKDDSLKVPFFLTKIDTTQIGSLRQGTASGGEGKKIHIDGYIGNQHLPSSSIKVGPVKKLVDSISLSSGESHRSEGLPLENNKVISGGIAQKLGDLVDKDIDGMPDGWACNTPTALQLVSMADGSRQLTIICQSDPVYLMKYFEVNEAEEHQIFLVHNGDEATITVAEYNADNQPVAEGSHSAFLERTTGKEFTMKLRTSNETRRIFFKIEVSSTGKVTLNKLVFQPVMTVRRSEP